MRTTAALALALLVLLAGCSAGFQGSPTPSASPSPTASETATPDAAGDGGATPAETATPAAVTAPPDPETDVLGWEDGRWYNETLAVNASDGLNRTELRAVIGRAMARVERIRQLEFEQRVPIEVVSRSTYRREFAGGNANYTPEFRQFDNAKFEALFLIGEDRDSLAVQNQNRGAAVLGFYSPQNDSIVLVSESETPTLSDELTLGHELVHALQDQHFNLTAIPRPTRAAFSARSGVIEGDANFVQERYRSRCDGGWDCISVDTGEDGGGSDLHLGVYILSFFPYSDGPGFVGYHFQRGGWDAVNDLYSDLPASDAQVIDPERYGEGGPTDVAVEDTNRNGWERVRPPAPRPGQARPDYAAFGQAGLTSMFAYTIYDSYNQSRLVSPATLLNTQGGSVNRTDPINYGLPVTDGWDGDRMHVYRNAAFGNETAYVWKIAWDSPADAEEFATGYRALLSHWGGQRVGERVWRIDQGPFADAFYVAVQGDTVVVVNAPTEAALADVSAEAR